MNKVGGLEQIVFKDREFIEIGKTRLMQNRFFCAVFISALAFSASAMAVDHFAENVRTTEPLTPELEAKAFHLPPGFEIQLVACEPDIYKPINIAFDARGRLWVTNTIEYPYAAKPGAKSRDRITILEDFGPDGRARKITTFAEGLNIPIGVYPYQNGAIAYNIPNIYQFRDTDGDGKSDQQEMLYGPFNYDRDVHGMTGSFQRGFDGWLYATHGFNNISSVKGKDGHEIHMNSGNTYRMKLDGSHLEQFTFGQVNPFGLTFDPLGNLYSADCETFPIYQLLRNAYYPSFFPGKPDDGLGFAPTMMNHKHGSTAIGGIIYYADNQFPPEFQGNIFVGNVVTSRINRDSLADHGSTRIAKQESDFVRTDDPWFRPVNQQLGPDGCIYVADFYNRIIGHYEVPLTHPGRDRERGRIWRIAFHPEGKPLPAPPRDRSNVTAAELIEDLNHPNITTRFLATNQLVDRIGAPAAEAVKQKLRGDATTFQKTHGLWVLQRLGSLDADLLASAAKDAERDVRVHAMRILAEFETLSAEQHQLLLTGLNDNDAFVKRAAADALGRHPDTGNIHPLLELRYKVPSDDTHLLHVVRIALRDTLIPAGNFSLLKLSEQDSHAIADVALAIPTEGSGSFLMQHLQAYSENKDMSVRAVRQAARYLPSSEMDALANLVRTKFSGDLELQLALFKSVQDGAAQRGAVLSEGVRAWAGELIEKLLKHDEAQTPEWTNSPLEGAPNSTDPWVVQKRQSADNTTALFLSSLPRGEQLTGVLRSKAFLIPSTLSFYMAGHNGQPPQVLPVKNMVRLRDADSKNVLIEAAPPRNDIAQKVTWDLKAHAGKQGYIEIVDGDSGSAYAWIAAGRFSPDVAKIPENDIAQAGERQKTAIEIAASLHLSIVEPRIAELLLSRSVDLETRAAAAKALVVLNPAAHVKTFAAILNDANEASALREKIGVALGESNVPEARLALGDAVRNAPERTQAKLALALASSKEGAETLLQAVTEGKVTPRLLQERAIAERLATVKPENLSERIAKLTQGLGAPDQQMLKVLDARRAAFNPEKALPLEGAKLFEKTCSVCHRMEGKGGLIGPNLDGIGARGLERVSEDVLDPNRNVDPTFRYSVVKLASGQVISGLQRREEGELLVFADSTGKEITVPKKEIKERKESKFSLMPDNFSEVLTQEDFDNLMAFLLSKRASQKTGQ